MQEHTAYQFWFCTGSQSLYGEATLVEVAEHSRAIVAGLNASKKLPFEVVCLPTLLDSAGISRLFEDANRDKNCAGVITWMHTFSPAKSWINGLQLLRKPLLHLHTQFNEAIPYESIDMDFMNTNQSAHGDREYGHIVTRMGIERKVVVGHWRNEKVQSRVADWMVTAIGLIESRNLRAVRVGDNMRNVAVTEGDKVEAQLKFGWAVDAYNITDIAEYVSAVPQNEVNALLDEYYRDYGVFMENRPEAEFRAHVAVQAQIELGFEKFLKEKNYHAIVTNFEMLGGLKQLPGLAIQRLMQKGYGFGAEGDWKTAALVRLFKQMTEHKQNKKGASFMEDYTYHLVPGEEGILQAHMLEICPSIAVERPTIRVNPLTMGQREDPARLVFTAKPGRGVAASLVDLGERFRLIINAVEVLELPQSMPKLPVASAFWRPEPDLSVGAEAWILAGGAHHTAFTYDLSVEQLVDWAAGMGVESVVIDKNTTIPAFKDALRWNAAAFRLGL